MCGEDGVDDEPALVADLVAVSVGDLKLLKANEYPDLVQATTEVKRRLSELLQELTTDR